MSLRPQEHDVVPAETVRVAHAIFPNGNFYLAMAKALQDCLRLYGDDGWRLLNAIFAINSPTWLRQVPTVEALQRV